MYICCDTNMIANIKSLDLRRLHKSERKQGRRASRHGLWSEPLSSKRAWRHWSIAGFPWQNRSIGAVVPTNPKGKSLYSSLQFTAGITQKVPSRTLRQGDRTLVFDLFIFRPNLGTRLYRSKCNARSWVDGSVMVGQIHSHLSNASTFRV